MTDAPGTAGISPSESSNAAQMERRPGVRSARSLRRAGSAMIVVAVVGVMVAFAGTIVAWRLLGELNTSTRDTLDVTIGTIDSVEDSIDLADQVLRATTESIDTASAMLDTLATSFEAGTGVVDEIDDLTTTIGPTLSDAAVTLRQLEDVGSTIDALLADLSSIPFAPDYEPDRELGESIGAVADEIEKLPAEFDQTSDNIAGFGVTLEDVQRQIRALASDIDAVNDGLSDTGPLISDYRRNIAEARAVAITTRDDLDGSVALMRLLLVIGGIVFAAGQLVPFWFGRELLERLASTEPSVDSPRALDHPTE